MRQLWQWLCGYVRICINGSQVNRFINLCSRNGIRLWRISYEMEHVLHANLGLSDFFELKPYLRKTKTHLRVMAKNGFPFWCYRHPKLKWFLCLVFLILCIGAYSFNFIWDIRITGNDKISTNDILEYLLDHDIKKGRRRNEINCPDIETILRERFDEIGWVSVYFEQTNLCIDIEESLYDTMEESVFLDSKQYNLVANKDAKIFSIVTREGEAQVIQGDVVKAGDILVIGQCRIYDDSLNVKNILYFPADAMVYGDVTYHIMIPLTEMEIFVLNLLKQFNEMDLYRIAAQKANSIIEHFNKNNKIVLDEEILIDKNEEGVCFRIILNVREQIGVKIPVEEILGNEFE